MKPLILFLISLWITAAHAQTSSLPLRVLNSNAPAKPLIFYISGDGGWGSFSNSLTQKLNQAGYAVLGLDAKKYFWTHRTPAEAAAAVSNAVSYYLKEWKRNNFVLIGYSFGADVAPFIQNRLAKNVAAALHQTFLLSPSARTDFEIHLINIMGIASSGGASVPQEINKLTNEVTVISGSDESDVPVQDIHPRTKRAIVLPGNHHYNNNTDALAQKIMETVH